MITCETSDEPMTIREINDRFDSFFRKCTHVAEVSIFPMFDLCTNVLLILSVAALVCLFFALCMVIVL